MTHNTREIEEGVDAVFQAVMSDLKRKYRVSDSLSDVLNDSLSEHLTTAITTLHQELQKAREEERGYAANTYKSFIQYIEEFNEPHTVVRICRTLLSELDQPNK
jgi:hypothetical protein